MKPTEIEGWALSVINRALAGQPVEDARVELKSKWPDNAHGAARRIAGHANAAHGEPILWLIGIDEKNRQVVGADYVELASWWSQVQSLFAELPIWRRINPSGVLPMAKGLCRYCRPLRRWGSMSKREDHGAGGCAVGCLPVVKQDNSWYEDGQKEYVNGLAT